MFRRLTENDDHVIIGVHGRRHQLRIVNLPHGTRGAHRIFFPGEGHRRRKESVVGGHHGECRARAYNGGLGQSPQRGPGAELLVRGSGGLRPLKLKAFWSLDAQRSRH